MELNRKTLYIGSARLTKSTINPEIPDLFSSYYQDSISQSNHKKEEFLELKQFYKTEEPVSLVSTFQKTINMITSSSFSKFHSISEITKMLNLPYGRTKLYRTLREKEILNSQNIPYQEYRDSGYFILHEKFRQNNAIQSDTVLLVTESGLNFIKILLNSDLNANLTLNTETL